ncbi:MAG: hypothetical protein MUC88_11550 [Planctomycetes bacterium]|nr:hypothetical protein [Planctomycetota bacterium]
MRMLSLVLIGVTLLPAAVRADVNDLDQLIQQAGNADSEEVRLETLRELRGRPGLDERRQQDLDRLLREIGRWNTDKSLDYFGSQVSRTRDYDFGIAPDSPLHPLTYLYRGRMLTWYALESGTVWRTPRLKRAFLDAARGFFEKAAAAFPENRIARMYLGQPISAQQSYPAVAGAPDWAVYQREGLERLTDIIEWWTAHRMRDDGQYGGGWGDDCEMWRWWTPILIGFESPGINQAQAKFSQAIVSQPHMKLGYTTRMSDVEHTAEDSGDAITAMMHLDPDNPDWSRRALRLAELMETRWTGRNERGFLQFQSTYFTAEKVDPTPARACDTVYHARVAQPTLLYWQRTGDPQLTKLFSTWMDTWVDAAARAERGKPPGILPTAIHWPDGGIGGLDPNWWDPRNHGEHTLYLFPSAMNMMTHTLLLTHHMTGDSKYLEPIRTMAKIRLDYLNAPPRDDPAPGTLPWCAARLDGMAEVVAKYKFLTGKTDLDAHTSEVRYTDRVLRLPTLFSADGILHKAVPGRGVPSPALLYSSVTGDPGTPEYFPMNAVRWLTPPRDIAVLVRPAADGLQAELFHFGRKDRPMGAEFYLLKPGSYVLTLTDNPAAPDIPRQDFTVTGPRTRVAFVLPAQTLFLLRVERR